MNSIKVTKRNGRKEPVMFDKILDRLNQQTYGLDLKWVEPFQIAQKVIAGITPDVETRVLDQLAMETAASLTTKHPDYATLAARIAITSLHKETDKSFSKTVKKLYAFTDPKTKEHKPIVAEWFYNFVMQNADELDSAIIHSRDHNFDYFGFKTLERGYLMKVNGKIVERPQYMYMREAIQVANNNINDIIETYNLLSEGMYTHATPTLFNSGITRNALSSCFVAGTKVFTLKGPKNIENVEIGDEVITHLGNIKKVVQLHKNLLNDRSIYDLKVLGTPNINVTGNHKFWSITKEQLKHNEQPQFNSVENLREGDYISIPKHNFIYEPISIDVKKYLYSLNANITIEYTEDKEYLYPKLYWEQKEIVTKTGLRKLRHSRKHTPIKKNIIIDSDFAFFLGVWLGDGHIITNKNNKNGGIRGIGITVHKDNRVLIDDLTKKIYNIFGIHAKITGEQKNIIQLHIHSMPIGNMFYDLFGKYFNGKKIPPFVYKWDKIMIDRLIEGLITSDGCVTTSGTVTFTMANIKLVKSLFSIFRNIGIMCHYTEEKKLKKGGTALTAKVAFNKTYVNLNNVLKFYNDNRLNEWSNRITHIQPYKIINNNTFIKVENIRINTELTPEFVYTLGVEDDHSYVVEGLIAENCFLLDVEDSIDGIYQNLKECAQISKNSGGIGINFSNVRSAGSHIAGTNGTSTGTIPFLRVYNATGKAVNQGGKRAGSIAVYMEPWHADIMDFLDLRKNNGHEDLRTRDLFLALWVNDLFMERVDLDENWTLMCPNECKGLNDVYGEDFRTLYESYEQKNFGKKTVKAREVWSKILESQAETGTPYMLYKDTINERSNQSNIGVVKSSNLCTEILEVSGISKSQKNILKNKELLLSLGLGEFYGLESVNETAVCNLLSIALPSFLNKNKTFNQNKLYEVVYKATINLNNVIDRTFYPSQGAKFSNLLHRPIGIGVQGLADVYFMLNIPFTSPEAKKLNIQIFETMYFAALSASCDLAKDFGTYATYEGSPASEGKLQFDMCGVTPSDKWDWKKLKEKIAKHGLRNSLLVAPPPTATTSSILGNSPAFEPLVTNIFIKRVLSGEFILLNKYLVKELIKLNLWNDGIRNKIINADGSVKNIPEIPTYVKEVFKTVWEIKQKDIIDMAADRGAFIDQSQSMNIFMENSFDKISSMHFYGWGRRQFEKDNNGNVILPTDPNCTVTYDKKGVPKFYRDKSRNLKTGMYYLRTEEVAGAVKFTTEKEIVDHKLELEPEGPQCLLDDPNCAACGA